MNGTIEAVAAQGAQVAAGELGVVLCGSFKRDSTGLAAAYADLVAAGCKVLSPMSLDFVGDWDGFVYTAEDIGANPARLEEAHLVAMTRADFVWLHAADGYVGASASLELGYAHALGIPVYCASPLSDVTLTGFVLKAESVHATVERVTAQLVARPGAGLQALQTHYRRAAQRRGWARETAKETVHRLEQEVVELGLAVNRRLADSETDVFSKDSAGSELADVQLYLVHLANILGIDLASSVTLKEEFNDARSRSRRSSPVV